ncbi:MAG TPA: hypothetical protein VGD56_21160, partial [Gemmatirosa sp.]
MPSRRTFLQHTAARAAAAGLALHRSTAATAPAMSGPVTPRTTPNARADAFVDLRRPPDRVDVQTAPAVD